MGIHGKFRYLTTGVSALQAKDSGPYNRSALIYTHEGFDKNSQTHEAQYLSTFLYRARVILLSFSVISASRISRL